MTKRLRRATTGQRLAPADTGNVASASVTLTQNSTTAVTGVIRMPPKSKIIDIIVDVTTAYNSGTSSTITAGTAAAGTQYAGSVDAKTAGRVRPTFSAAQLAAMADVGANTSVFVTQTPVGATSAGVATVTVLYAAP